MLIVARCFDDRAPMNYVPWAQVADHDATTYQNICDQVVSTDVLHITYEFAP